MTEKERWERLSYARRWLEFYRCCRNKGGRLHAMGETSPWRALKFACSMTWWRIRRDIHG